MDLRRNLAALLVVLNVCICIIVSSIAGWALNYSIQNDYYIGNVLVPPEQYSPVYFPIGNGATGFFVVFSLIAGVVGAASAIAGFAHVRSWHSDSLPAAQSSAFLSWTLSLLATGLAFKEISLEGRNSRLKTMEAFSMILSVTQFEYIFAIRGASSDTNPERTWS